MNPAGTLRTSSGRRKSSSGNQDGRGHAGRPGPRAFHAALLGRSSLGRPILGTKETVESVHGRRVARLLRQHLHRTEPDCPLSATTSTRVRELIEAVRPLPRRGEPLPGGRAHRGADHPSATRARAANASARSYPRSTTPATKLRTEHGLGGSMSSRLFQNVMRERAGSPTPSTAGWARTATPGRSRSTRLRERGGRKVVDLVVEELREVRRTPVPSPNCAAPRIT